MLRMCRRSSTFAWRAASGVAANRASRRRSSSCSATTCSRTSVGIRGLGRSGGRPEEAYDDSRWARSRAISSDARRLGGSGRSSSSTETSRAPAMACSSDSRGSRRPFSIIDSAELAAPTADASWASVMPRVRRRWRIRWPSVTRSRSAGGAAVRRWSGSRSSAYVKISDSSRAPAVTCPTGRAYVKHLGSSLRCTEERSRGHQPRGPASPSRRPREGVGDQPALEGRHPQLHRRRGRSGCAARSRRSTPSRAAAPSGSGTWSTPRTTSTRSAR